MTYQVLARKYRPQRFSEVVGQEHITTTLLNAISAGRLHHAYLFAGARGVGKTTVARILAKAINCEKKDGPEPCDKCKTCEDIGSGASMNVQEIDGASNTGVDDIRELREHAKYLPSSGKYKIYIIDEVHMLSTSAFNALLKTLEEPPAHVVFIFATTESHKIPATILSRCQRYDFRRIPAGAIAKTLKIIADTEKVKIDEDSLHLIAREATGSLRDAESLFDQAIAFSGNSVDLKSIKAMLGFLDRKLLFDALGAAVNKDPKSALLVLDEVFETGSDLVRFAMDILEMVKHLLVLAECKGESSAIDLPPDEIAELKKIYPGAKPEVLHQMFSIWYRVTEEVARSSFPKMMLEVGLIRLCRAGEFKAIEEVLAKIDAMMNQGQGTEKASGTGTGDRGSVSHIPSPVSRVSSPVSRVPDSHPTFEAITSPADAVAERKWEEFMRWLANEKPQIASIFSNGELVGVENNLVKMKFGNQLYADMIVEDARKAQLETLFSTFFKRPLKLKVEGTGQTADRRPQTTDQKQGKGAAIERKKELTKEVLNSDIVKQAADILNAQLHDIKIDEK